jgi:hypothetical protein
MRTSSIVFHEDRSGCNVLIAALIARGVCSELVAHCAVRHVLITAAPILDDVQEHLVKKFKYADEEAAEARVFVAILMMIL